MDKLESPTGWGLESWQTARLRRTYTHFALEPFVQAARGKECPIRRRQRGFREAAEQRERKKKKSEQLARPRGLLWRSKRCAGQEAKRHVFKCAL